MTMQRRMYSHEVTTFRPISEPVEPAARERSGAPVSADSTGAAIAADRPLDSTPCPATAAADGLRALDGDPVRVAIVGATGYVGAELDPAPGAPPPRRASSGLVGRERQGDPIGRHPPPPRDRRGLRVFDAVPDDAEAVFLALPHGAAAAPDRRVPGRRARRSSTSGPTSGSTTRRDYPRWYHFDHPRPDLLATAVYGLPELHRDGARRRSARRRGAIVGSPGCYATTTILALAPLARAGLIADLVVDAKSGVSGAGRDPRRTSSSARSTRASRRTGSSPTATSARSSRSSARSAASGGEPGRPRRRLPAPPHPDDPRASCPPATSGRRAPVTQAELDDLYRDAYGDEPFVTVVDAPPATKHVLGSNEARVWCRARRAERPRARDRRPRQPRQGRRGPGDPGVQRRPRPARDGRPAPAAARALTPDRPDPEVRTMSSRPTRSSRRSPTRPAVERAARLPAGFRAAGATAGIKASGGPDLVAGRGDGRARCPPPRSRRPTGSRRPRSGCRGRTSQATGGGARRPGYARAVVATSGQRQRRDRPRGRRRPGGDRRGGRQRPSAAPAAEVLHLSTGRHRHAAAASTSSRRPSPGSSAAASRRPTARSRRPPRRCARPTPRRRPRR